MATTNNTTKTANPYGTLTHNAYVPTYVGLPIARMKETADILQDKYNTAVANDNTTKTQLAQMSLNEQDEKKRLNALKGYNDMMAGFRKTGNYEDANTTIANGATGIATNSGLIAALRSKAEQDKQYKIQDLQIQAGQASQEDVDFVRKVASETYASTEGVYLDEETGAWKGGYDAESIPKIQNIGEVANKFLKGYKSNTFMGEYVKAVDPADGKLKWFDKQYGKKDATGLFIVAPNTKEARIGDVMFAAQKHLMQDPAVDARLKFDMKRDGITFNNLVEKYGDSPYERRSIMRYNLINQLGYEASQINQLTDDELALEYEKNTRVQNSIIGAAGSAAFTEESMQLLGDSLEGAARKAALKGGGDENTPNIDKTYHQMMTKGYSIGGLPATDAAYKTQIASMIEDSQKREATIQKKKVEYQKWLKDNPGKSLPAAKVTELAKMESARATHDNNIRQFEKSYSEAIDRVTANNPQITPKGIQKAKDDLKASIAAGYETQYAKNIEDYERMKTLGMEYEDLRWIKEGIAVTGAHHMNYKVAVAVAKTYNLTPPTIGKHFTDLIYKTPEYQAAIDEIKGLSANILASDSMFNDYQLNMLGKYEAIGQREKLKDSLISDELDRMSKANTIQYSYINLSTEDNRAGATAGSSFTRDASSQLHDDPGSFIKIGTDGQEMLYENTATRDWNPQNMKVLGPTSDYVHGHGILFYASEKIMDTDGKTQIDTKMHLLKDTTGTWKSMALTQMQKGRLIKDGAVKNELGFHAMDDIKYKFLYEEIDKQISYFQTLPAAPPPIGGPQYNTAKLDVTCGPNSYANVVRKVAGDGSTTYDAIFNRKVDKNGQKLTTPVETYTSIANLEKALEHWGGVGKDSEVYKIPMSTLTKVTEAEIPYAKFKMGASSMPRLEAKFKIEVSRFANSMKLPFVITSMVQSEKYNTDIGGAKNESHMYGQGININGKDVAEFQKITDWLQAKSDAIDNSEYRRVRGTDIIYTINKKDASYNHIDLKYSKR